MHRCGLYIKKLKFNGSSPARKHTSTSALRPQLTLCLLSSLLVWAMGVPSQGDKTCYNWVPAPTNRSTLSVVAVVLRDPALLFAPLSNGALRPHPAHALCSLSSSRSRHWHARQNEWAGELELLRWIAKTRCWSKVQTNQLSVSVPYLEFPLLSVRLGSADMFNDSICTVIIFHVQMKNICYTLYKLVSKLSKFTFAGLLMISGCNWDSQLHKHFNSVEDFVSIPSHNGSEMTKPRCD